jgi:5-hydroxyisourate hydrolase-like protein (transthyretin family)
VGTPFTVAASPGGKAPYGYAWSVTGPCALSSATAAGPSVTCSAAGVATVSVTVRQNDGQTVTAGPAAVTVSEATAPAARATSWSTPARVGSTPLRFTATLRDSATGAALAGLPVELQLLPAGASTWTTAATGLSTGPDGSVTAGPSAGGAGSYRFVFAGTADQAATTSSAVLVKEATALRARVDARHRVVVGQLTTVTGEPVTGVSIRLERQTVGSSTWSLVLQRTTGRDGTAGVRVRRPRKATYYRWVFAGGATQTNALSGRVRLG